MNKKEEFKTVQVEVYNLGAEKSKISDGYHTFEELYEFRKLYNAALFNQWGIIPGFYNGTWTLKHDVHKSWRHNDGELCFGGGWFVVVAILPDGQITNHYEAKDWDLFKIPEFEKAKYPFDGHTSEDVLKRLRFVVMQDYQRDKEPWQK